MSNRSIRTRLMKLEQPFVRGACPACGTRTGLIQDLFVCEQAPDGELIPMDGKELPKPCPRCGQLPDVLVEILEVVTPTLGETPND